MQKQKQKQRKTNTNIKEKWKTHTQTYIHFEKQGYRHPTYRIECGDAECLFAVKFEACNAYEIEFLANAIAMEFVVTPAGYWLLATGCRLTETEATTSFNNSIWSAETFWKT